MSTLKMHAIVGVNTNMVAAVQITDRNTHDSPVFQPLVEASATHFNMERVSADKAYSSRRNLETVEQIGATPYVPFKINAVESADSPTWNKLYHYFHLNRDEFLCSYHRRSNAESTFSAIKRKFGDFVRSNTPTAQVNEALLKVLCHNIVCVIHEIHESGIEAEFPMLTVAQELEPLPKNSG